VALVVLGVAVFVGWRYSVGRELESMTLLADVQRAEAKPVLEGAASGEAYATSDEKYRDVLKLAEMILEKYPSSTSALWAGYYKALSQKELGSLDEAMSTIGPLKEQTRQAFIASASRILEGRILEERGDLDGALEAFASLAAAAPGGFPVEMALANQARILEAQGKADQAKEIYRRITLDFPQSPFAGEASRRLQSEG
jgi:tetratricopeptide (TPR) repeat protein